MVPDTSLMRTRSRTMFTLSVAAYLVGSMTGAARVFHTFPPSDAWPLAIPALHSNTNIHASTLFIRPLLEIPLYFFIRTAVLTILYGFGSRRFRFARAATPVVQHPRATCCSLNPWSFPEACRLPPTKRSA